MRLLADENFPKSAVDALRAAGHDIMWARLEAPGATDPTVLARAAAEGRVLLTFDKDFGELAFRSRLPAASGIVLFRAAANSPDEAAALAVRVLGQTIPFAGHFAVVEEGRIRVVELPE